MIKRKEFTEWKEALLYTAAVDLLSVTSSPRRPGNLVK